MRTKNLFALFYFPKQTNMPDTNSQHKEHNHNHGGAVVITIVKQGQIINLETILEPM